MSKIRVGRAVAILISLLVAGLFALVYFSYRRDIHQARERISVGSQIVETPCGPIEYAVAGGGPPVLVVHGAGGGYDQGMDFSKPLVQSGFRVIAMSRFGYLRTPLPADASAAAQADAHACLLDALHIQRVAVVGASAGAPSINAVCAETSGTHCGTRPAGSGRLSLSRRAETGGRDAKADLGRNRILCSIRHSSRTSCSGSRPGLHAELVIRAILGTPPSVVENASAEERARVAHVLDLILPVSARRLGLLNDAAITASSAALRARANCRAYAHPERG